MNKHGAKELNWLSILNRFLLTGKQRSSILDMKPTQLVNKHTRTEILTGVTNDEQLEEMMVVFSCHSSGHLSIQSLVRDLKVPGRSMRRVLGEILQASYDCLSRFPQNPTLN